ncbi:MAG: NrfD/PsrC family molybdoenzyme membrane anchor subunit [Nocardioidaceae bacterium]
MKGERPVVPDARFESYYGRPVLKRPVWKQPDVPLYLFLGGAAGTSAMLAEGAALAGLPGLERVTRVAAATGAGLGTVALVHDLGRPERFLNMLRVFKPTSPLSIGSWILAPFAATSATAALSNVTGFARPLGRLAGVGAALLGPPLTTYTAALICNTAVPAWHEAYREMPFLFAGSGATAAAGIAIAAAPLGETSPARRLAVAGAAAELVMTERIRQRLGMLAQPYHQGKAGAMMKTARALTVAGAVGGAVGGRSRLLSTVSGAALVAGSVLTRFGVFNAGLASADDPKYTVVPQRERLTHKDPTLSRP